MLSTNVKNILITMTHMHEFLRTTKYGGYYDTFDDILKTNVTVDCTHCISKGITTQYNYLYYLKCIHGAYVC